MIFVFVVVGLMWERELLCWVGCDGCEDWFLDCEFWWGGVVVMYLNLLDLYMLFFYEFNFFFDMWSWLYFLIDFFLYLFLGVVYVFIVYNSVWCNVMSWLWYCSICFFFLYYYFLWGLEIVCDFMWRFFFIYLCWCLWIVY